MSIKTKQTEAEKISNLRKKLLEAELSERWGGAGALIGSIGGAAAGSIGGIGGAVVGGAVGGILLSHAAEWLGNIPNELNRRTFIKLAGNFAERLNALIKKHGLEACYDDYSSNFEDNRKLGIVIRKPGAYTHPGYSDYSNMKGDMPYLSIYCTMEDKWFQSIAVKLGRANLNYFIKSEYIDPTSGGDKGLVEITKSYITIDSALSIADELLTRRSDMFKEPAIQDPIKVPHY